MQYRFLVTIDTEESNSDELQEAIQDNLRLMEMPNGDSLELNAVDATPVQYSASRVS